MALFDGGSTERAVAAVQLLDRILRELQSVRPGVLDRGLARLDRSYP